MGGGVKTIDQTVKKVQYEESEDPEDSGSDYPSDGEDVTSGEMDMTSCFPKKKAMQNTLETAFNKALQDIAAFFETDENTGDDGTEAFAKIVSGALRHKPADKHNSLLSTLDQETCRTFMCRKLTMTCRRPWARDRS